MVLSGQDAWRKHPLLAGCWKKPFPHLGLAIGIFTTYVIAENIFTRAMEPPLPDHKPTMKFTKTGDLDTMPKGKKIH